MFLRKAGLRKVNLLSFFNEVCYDKLKLVETNLLEVIIMIRCIKGGFITLSGIIGIVGMIIAAMQNPAAEWVTPPGKLITGILENGLVIPLILFIVLFAYGFYILLTANKQD